MKEKKKLPGWLKGVIIAGSVLAFLLVLMLGAELWAKRKIRSVIEERAVAIAGTPVDVRVGRIGVSIPTMTLSVRRITLKSQNSDPANRDAALVSLDAGVDRISLRGIGYRKVDGKPALSARALVIDRPYGTVVTKTVKKTDGTAEEPRDFRQMVTGHLGSVSIENIGVRDAAVDYVAWTTDGENTRVTLAEGRLEAGGFRIDSLAPADRVLFCDDIGFDAGRLSYGFAAGSMIAEIDTVSVRSAGTLSIAAFRLVPQYGKHEFARKSKGHKDWTEVAVAGIDCFGIDFARLVSEGTVSVDSVSLGSAAVASYKNRQVYQAPEVKPMVWQTVQQLPVPVEVRSVSFRDVAVQYDELSETGTEPGVVKFSEGRGEVRNLTNITEDSAPYWEVSVAALLMNSGEVNATCYFPVNPSNDHFRVTGSVGRTDMTGLNPVLTPLMNIRMNSGTMNSLEFDLNGNHTESHIEVTMLYNDLSVSMLKPGKPSEERGFLTFVADDIFLKSDNPKGNGHIRSGSGNYRHDPYRSMYNYMWKSFIPGIIKIVI